MRTSHHRGTALMVLGAVLVTVGGQSTTLGMGDSSRPPRTTRMAMGSATMRTGTGSMGTPQRTTRQPGTTVAGMGMGMGAGMGAAVNYSEPGLKGCPLRGTIGTAIDGETIYGPFEAGFNRENIQRLATRAGRDCASETYEAPGGLDTNLAEMAIKYECGWTDISLLDACGGHTNYHYHERLQCLWNSSDPSGHSSLAGVLLDGHNLYGFWEAAFQLPALDACNGHFGYTPDSPNEMVYHYHISREAPFTAGCYGPKVVDGVEHMVTVSDCRSLYATCDGVTENVLTEHGTTAYDLDCPCYDGLESTTGNTPLLFEAAGSNATIYATPAPTVPGEFDRDIGGMGGAGMGSTSGSDTTAMGGMGDMGGMGGMGVDMGASIDRTAAPTGPPVLPPTHPPSEPFTGRRKSVLLFMPDDMPFLWPESPQDPRQDQPSMDTALVPNMNRIRDEGVTFLTAYTAGPKCAPARFNLMTGRYCSRSTYARDGPDVARISVDVPSCKISGHDVQNTMPKALRDVGYRTIVSGKWHLLPGAEATENWWGNYSRAASEIKETGFTDDGGIYASNMQENLDFTHNLDWMVSRSRAAMDDAVNSDTPFFLYFASTMPHSPNSLQALQRGDILATPNGSLSSPPSDTGLPSRSSLVDMIPEMENQRWRQRVAGTIATDFALGSLLNKMDSLEVLDSTLVIVMMDHGMIAKDTIYEGGTRIAMMARLPGVFRAGSTISRPVTNLDVVPTILEFAHTRATYPTDGISWLRANSTGRRRDLLHARKFLFYEIDTDRAVLNVESGLKLISRLQSASNDINNYPASSDLIQLYNTVTDPAEQTNIAFDPNYSDQLAQLQAALRCQDRRTRPSNPEVYLECDAGFASFTTDDVTSVSATQNSVTYVTSTTSGIVSATDSGVSNAAASSDDDLDISTGATVGIIVAIVVIGAVLVAVLHLRRSHNKATHGIIVSPDSEVADRGTRGFSSGDNPVYDGGPFNA